MVICLYTVQLSAVHVCCWKRLSAHTVRPVLASTLILERVESSSAESNMLQVRHICTFLFPCFSSLECAPDEAYLTTQLVMDRVEGISSYKHFIGGELIASTTNAVELL